MKLLKLAENFLFKTNTKEEIILGHLTYAAARLYNIGNYQRHNWTQASGQDYPDWYQQKKDLKNEFWYKNLPSQTAQETLKILSDNWKSYFNSIKDYQKNPEKIMNILIVILLIITLIKIIVLTKTKLSSS